MTTTAADLARIIYENKAELSLDDGFAAIYAKITRIAPERASALATAILIIGEKIGHADSLDRLQQLEDELEKILRDRDRVTRRHHLERRALYVQARL